ncbi:MAG TPA: NfeD family protein [Methylibium sp.]|nr:NfeD family protein [Methylibium sp.]
MDWSASTWWWVGCGLLVAAELSTGTFYLLMLALGLAAAALSAHAGLGLAAQLVAAAVVGGGAVVALRRQRRKRAAEPARSNRDVNLDIGEQVRVDSWNSDGSAQVSYRGAQWSARWSEDTPPTPGLCTIRAIEGSRLLLGR